MLPPNELKKKDFTRVVRGYSSVEVEEYIDFLMEQYTELYRENDELERKLRNTAAKLESIKKDEESIRSALVNAQRASSTIIAEANDRAEVVMKTTKNTCNKILAEFRVNIRRERDELLKLRAVTEKFKADLFDAYSTHIDYIEKINTVPEGMENVNITEEAFVRQALDDIKDGVVGSLNKPEDEPLPETNIAPPPAIIDEEVIPPAEPETAVPPVTGNADLYLSDDETPLPPEEAMLPEEPIPEEEYAQSDETPLTDEPIAPEEEAEPDEEFFQLLNVSGQQDSTENLDELSDLLTETPEEDEAATRLFDPAFAQSDEEDLPYPTEDKSLPEAIEEEVFVEETEEEAEEDVEEIPPAFVHAPVSSPARKADSASGGSVKSSIIALNKMFAMEDEDEDVLGEEEFSDFNPSNMNAPLTREEELPNDEFQEEEIAPIEEKEAEKDEFAPASTVEAISEYQDFLRSLDEITGKNDKKNTAAKESSRPVQERKGFGAKNKKKNTNQDEFDFI